MIPTMLGPALGPIVGGFFIDTWSWRLIFLINVPVGAVALAFGLRALPADVIRHPGRLDVAGSCSPRCSSGWVSCIARLDFALAIVGATLIVGLAPRSCGWSGARPHH